MKEEDKREIRRSMKSELYSAFVRLSTQAAPGYRHMAEIVHLLAVQAVDTWVKARVDKVARLVRDAGLEATFSREYRDYLADVSQILHRLLQSSAWGEKGY